jgi:protein-tyrosine kinase
MNKQSSIKSSGSLLERAAEIYDFGAALRGGAAPVIPEVVEVPVNEPVVAVETTAPTPATPRTVSVSKPMAARPLASRFAEINRERLAAHNFIVPDGPVSGLSEEFRIVKRQLLLTARGGRGFDAIAHGERILVCSAHPNEGKTYCAINLALSMASEKDNRVLLVDADFAKPSVLSTLGIESGPGFMDALADDKVDAETYIIETDIEGLSILPAGARTNQDTEYLAAARTAQIIDDLTRNDPSRIIIFDSPPALAASPASVLALHVGQVLMIVHADETTDGALRDALGLLSGCDHVQLLLNRAKFSPTGRKFGNYYGYGAS